MHITVVATHYDPTQPDATGGSGIAVYRICQALALQEGVVVTLVCTCDSKVDDLKAQGVRVLFTETASQNGIDSKMAMVDYDALGELFYRQVAVIIESLPTPPDRIIFNAAYAHALVIKHLTMHQLNMVHVPYGRNPWGERYPIPELGLMAIAVSDVQRCAAPEYYAASVDNCLPLTTDALPFIGPKHWPPRRAVYINRIVHEKGADLAIAACRVMREMSFAPDLEVHLCGGTDGSAFANEVFANAPAWVHYHGQVDGVTRDRLIDGSDLGFFTPCPRRGWKEAFGLVAAEKLIRGVPLVAFEGMGFVPDYATPNTTLVMPWRKEYEPIWGGPFAQDLLAAIKGFTPDWQACQDSVRDLTLDRYGAKLLELARTV